MSQNDENGIECAKCVVVEIGFIIIKTDYKYLIFSFENIKID